MVSFSLAASLLFLNAEACPGSGAWFGHAKCQFTVKFVQPCSDVEAEIAARGEHQNGWFDPHNGGTYSILNQQTSSIELQRVTGGGSYTDKMTFDFQADGSGCQVNACSESQVTSLYDSGTNFCNLWDLFCNSDNCNASTGICCKPILHDLQDYTVTTGPSCNTSSNCPSGPSDFPNKCLVKAASSSTLLEALEKLAGKVAQAQ